MPIRVSPEEESSPGIDQQGSALITIRTKDIMGVEYEKAPVWFPSVVSKDSQDLHSLSSVLQIALHMKTELSQMDR